MKLKVTGRVWASRVEIGVGMGLAPALLSVRSILQGSQPSFTSTALCPYLVTALECRDVSQERLTNPLGKSFSPLAPQRRCGAGERGTQGHRARGRRAQINLIPEVEGK